MEHISKHLQSVEVSQQEQKTSLMKVKNTLEPYEAQVLDLKYKAPRFNKLSETDLQVTARALLFKIHVVTGWVMSEDKTHREVLLDQFAKKLVESYSTINSEEFEYAMRTYGPEIKDWGKQMNLSLIDEVMAQYGAYRREISNREEQKASRITEAPKQSDITNQDWYNETKKQVKEKKLTVDFVPVELYEWALKNDLIDPTKEEKWDYFLQAINLRQSKIYADLMLFNTDKSTIKLWEDFMRMKGNQCFEGDELQRLRTLSKRLLLFDHMKNED